MSALAQFLDLRPHGGFNMIMADPPWRFDLRSEAGEDKAPQAHYGCESTDAICALPVEAIAGTDCLLWLWATNPMLPDALRVIDAWGFKFKTAGTWAKRTVRGKDAFGTGYVLRSSNEPFLIATRGAPKTTRSTRSTVVSFESGGVKGSFDHQKFDNDPDREWLGTVTIEAKIREHSRKPEEAFEAAELLMPSAKRIELFSRQFREGWSVWGNEVGKFDE